MNKESQRSVPNCSRAVWIGAAGFTAVSLAGFAVWALAGSWFYRHAGEAGLYLASAFVFLALAGLFLHPLIRGERRVVRLYRAFVPAFFGYALVWSVCWFLFKFGWGEWLGSLAGCAVFAAILRNRLGSAAPLGKPLLILFLAHSAGYFLGSAVYMSKVTPRLWGGLSKREGAMVARMLWGLFYGLGFGAGIGFMFDAFQRPRSAGSAAGPASANEPSAQV